ncbi:MAG: hypothetical protein ABI359_07845 [Ginsengibacter sp.]
MKKIIKRFVDWHHWPFFPFYFPLFFVWAWYIIKSRSLWFFSSSNPTLTFGGFEGETKKEMYDLLPPGSYPKTLYIDPKISFPDLLQLIKSHSFSFPFIVKPNVGMEGILFRKIDNEKQLEIYHAKITFDYLVQELVDFPLEIGLFYIRHPNENSGKITALFSKKFPIITGNGISTIGEILQKNNCKIVEESGKLTAEELQRILPKNETFPLSFVGNRYHGTSFHDLSELIDKSLLSVFDKLSLSSSFYYGRYDIKCASIEDLKNEINFSILEFNGAGSIPNHVYTGNFTLIKAYKEIIGHWKSLYEISAHNYENGYIYWKFWDGLRYILKAKRNFRKQKKQDKKIRFRL